MDIKCIIHKNELHRIYRLNVYESLRLREKTFICTCTHIGRDKNLGDTHRVKGACVYVSYMRVYVDSFGPKRKKKYVNFFFGGKLSVVYHPPPSIHAGDIGYASLFREW